MKQFIFILLSVAMFNGCQESNSVEPIFDNSHQINKFEEDPFTIPILDGNGEEKAVKCDYAFNPAADCGGLLNGSIFKYRYDDAITDGVTKRYLENVEIYAPSIMQLGAKEFTEVCMIYTLNRTEIIGLYNMVIGGETWGTFKVVESNGAVPNDKCTVLFEGEFKGDIDFNITKRTLFAEGKNSFNGRQFYC